MSVTPVFSPWSISSWSLARADSAINRAIPSFPGFESCLAATEASSSMFSNRSLSSSLPSSSIDFFIPFFSTTSFTNSDGASVSAARASSLIIFSNASIFASSPARRLKRCPAANLPSVTRPIPRGGTAAARSLSVSREGSIARRIHARASFTSLRAKNRVPRIL